MIEKPWCIYGNVFPYGIGKIESENKETAIVRYSERQCYPLKYWDTNYLKRFATVTEAIKEFAPHVEGGLLAVIGIALQNFPSQKEEILSFERKL